jgi:hypothetical protein
MTSCNFDESMGNLSFNLDNEGGASPYSSPRKSVTGAQADSISSISFDASYASVFGGGGGGGADNFEQNSSNLCLSRWESLGDSNSNIGYGLGGRRGKEEPVPVTGTNKNNISHNRLPSIIIGGPGSAAAPAPAPMPVTTPIPVPMPRAAMAAMKIPRRQQFSSRPNLCRVSSTSTSSSTGSTLLAFGDSTTLDHQSSSLDANEEERQQRQHHQQHRRGVLPSMTKFKHGMMRRRSLTHAASSEKSSVFGLGGDGASVATSSTNHTFATYSMGGDTFADYSKGGQSASNHRFADYSKDGRSDHSFAEEYSKGGRSNHSFAEEYSKGGRSNHTFADYSKGGRGVAASLSNHTLASIPSFASSNHTSTLSTWESVEEEDSFEGDSTIASFFSSATATSLSSKQLVRQLRRRRSTGDAFFSSSSLPIHSVAGGCDDLLIQQQGEQREQY